MKLQIRRRPGGSDCAGMSVVMYPEKWFTLLWNKRVSLVRNIQLRSNFINSCKTANNLISSYIRRNFNVL